MLHQSFNFSTISSTQDEAKKIAKKLPPGTIAVVSAKVQEGGKGRQNRFWDSPKGNIYLTFILPTPLGKRGQASTLSLVLASCTSEFLGNLKIGVGIKWPNDLLINGAKIAGILGEGSDPLFLGIGINVASHPSLDRPTTSLNEALGIPLDLETVKEGVIQHFLQGYEKWLDEGFGPFFQQWSSLLIHKKGDTLKLGDKQATFLEADKSGGIWVEIGGEKRLIASGEIN